jgi:colanic acid/amylovoran biosynthesis glycosyltransferase
VKLLTVARLVEKKGLAPSIRAVARVRANHPNLRYDIVGEGPLRGELERLIGSQGLSGIVTLHGAREGEQVRKMMEQAHLFVLGSMTAADGDQEGTPVSLLEAQACGLPVLSTDHAGISEIVLPGRSGVLVPEGDETRLAEGLADLLAHPEAWPSMGREGRTLVETSHDRDRQVRRLVALYDQLVHPEATRHV